jgi:hypothetical protein
MNRLRAALAASTLSLLSACTASIPIDVTRDVTLQAPAGSFDATQVIDLSTESALWSHRSDVDGVSIDEVTATVVSLGSAHTATSATLSLSFRPDGAPADGSQDLLVGSFGRLAFVPGTTVSLPGSAELDALLLSVVKGSGAFSAVAKGTVDGEADAVIELGLTGRLAYTVISGK